MSDETRFSSREHWLLMQHGAIVGCQCGFLADEDDNGYGDSVVDHIAEVAAAAVVAERDRLRQAVEAAQRMIAEWNRNAPPNGSMQVSQVSLLTQLSNSLAAAVAPEGDTTDE